jgi:hypothetical protein
VQNEPSFLYLIQKKAVIVVFALDSPRQLT